MRVVAASGEYELVKYRGKLAVAIGRGKDRRRISTGTADAGLARVVAQQIWEKLHAPASERVEDLWRLYLADRRKDRKDVTRQENAWKRLEPVFGQRLGTDISKDDCRAYAKLRQRHGAAPGTARTELEYLRACLNLRYGRGHNRVWMPTGSPPRDRYLARDELEQLLAHTDTPHVRLFIILAITTGARMSALLELQWEQVDFKHRTINFNAPGREQSNKRRPEVPLQCPRLRRTGGSLARRSDRLGDRVGWQAGKEHQEGNPHGGQALQRALLTACLPPHCRRLDGPGRCADAEDLPVPRAHLDARHRAHLRSLQSVVYEGCCGCTGVLITRAMNRNIDRLETRSTHRKSQTFQSARPGVLRIPHSDSDETCLSQKIDLVELAAWASIAPFFDRFVF